MLSKQDCFVMNDNLDSPVEEPEIDSDGEEGPKNNVKWWSDLNSTQSKRLIDGIVG